MLKKKVSQMSPYLQIIKDPLVRRKKSVLQYETMTGDLVLLG